MSGRSSNSAMAIRIAATLTTSCYPFLGVRAYLERTQRGRPDWPGNLVTVFASATSGRHFGSSPE